MVVIAPFNGSIWHIQNDIGKQIARRLAESHMSIYSYRKDCPQGNSIGTSESNGDK